MAAPLEEGAIVGSYRVGPLLGMGGAGAVHVVEDTRTGASAAIKALHPALAEKPEARRRFLREARIAMAI